MPIKGGLIALLAISLLCIGDAASETHDCSMDACDYPEDVTRKEFCSDVHAYVACMRKEVVENTRCSRMERAAAATLIVRVKLDHKQCVLSDMEKSGVISKDVAEKASSFYRKDEPDHHESIEESALLEVQVCGFDDEETEHLEICETFHEPLDHDFFEHR